jgi:hypothetical protein
MTSEGTTCYALNLITRGERERERETERERERERERVQRTKPFLYNVHCDYKLYTLYA